jgi:hypothetical protein
MSDLVAELVVRRFLLLLFLFMFVSFVDLLQSLVIGM